MSDLPSYAPEDESAGEGSDELESRVQPAPVQPAAVPMPRRKRSQIFAADRPKERRRRHSRIDVQLPVEIMVEGSDERVKSRCANLSLGGMFVLLAPAPAHGTKLRIWLSLPTGDSLMVTGTVRWSTRDGLGVQHELLGARDTFLLTQYLASLKAAPDDPPDSSPDGER